MTDLLVARNIIHPTILPFKGSVDITFVYGNNNRFNVSIGRYQKVYSLYYIATQVLNTEILYLCCNGRVLGIDLIENELSTFGPFLSPTQVVSIVLKHPDVVYTTEDLYIHNYIRATCQSSSAEQGQTMLNYIMAAHLITVPEERYPDIVTVDQSDEEGRTCTICQEGLLQDQLCHRLACGHVFHAECIHRTLTTVSVECPICSYDVRGT